MTPAIERAIRAISDRNGGTLTPEMVVDAAKAKDSPLHSCFTWDVKRAAHAHWIDQARSLIRSVRVEVTTTNFALHVPAFVRDPGAASDAQGYVSLGRLRTDQDMARDAVVNEFSRAAAALSRAKDIAAALGLSGQIEEVRNRVVGLSERISQPAVNQVAA